MDEINQLPEVTVFAMGGTRYETMTAGRFVSGDELVDFIHGCRVVVVLRQVYDNNRGQIRYSVRLPGGSSAVVKEQDMRRHDERPR